MMRLAQREVQLWLTTAKAFFSICFMRTFRELLETGSLFVAACRTTGTWRHFPWAYRLSESREFVCVAYSRFDESDTATECSAVCWVRRHACFVCI